MCSEIIPTGPAQPQTQGNMNAPQRLPVERPGLERFQAALVVGVLCQCLQTDATRSVLQVARSSSAEDRRTRKPEGCHVTLRVLAEPVAVSLLVTHWQAWNAKLE